MEEEDWKRRIRELDLDFNKLSGIKKLQFTIADGDNGNIIKFKINYKVEVHIIFQWYFKPKKLDH